MILRFLNWLGIISIPKPPENGCSAYPDDVEMEEVPEYELAGDPSASDVIRLRAEVSTKARKVINKAKACQATALKALGRKGKPEEGAE